MKVIDKAFGEVMIKGLPYFQIDIGEIELRVLDIHISPDQIPGSVNKDTDQKQGKLIIIPDVLELCSAFQIPPYIPVRFFRLHEHISFDLFQIIPYYRRPDLLQPGSLRFFLRTG